MAKPMTLMADVCRILAVPMPKNQTFLNYTIDRERVSVSLIPDEDTVTISALYRTISRVCLLEFFDKSDFIRLYHEQSLYEADSVQGVALVLERQRKIERLDVIPPAPRLILSALAQDVPLEKAAPQLGRPSIKTVRS